MFRIDNVTAVTVMPTPEAPGPHPVGYFTRGDFDAAIEPTPPHHDWLNALQEELCYLVESTGDTLDKADQTQVWAALNAIIPAGGGGFNHVVDDTSPQLGGNFDFADYAAESNFGYNIYFSPNGTGVVNLDSAHIYLSNALHRNFSTNKISSVDGFSISGSTKLSLASGGVKFAGTGTTFTAVLDDDTQAADSTSALITQQSAKAYVDTNLSAVNSSFFVSGALQIATYASSFYFFNGGTSSTPSSNDLWKAFAYKVQADGVISNLYCFVTRANIGATPLFTLYNYLTTTTMVCSLAANQTGKADNTHTYSVTAGEYLIMKVAGIGASCGAGFNFKFTPD